MAAAFPLRKQKKWRKDGFYTVEVVQDIQANVEAEVRLVCFETDRPHPGFEPKLENKNLMIVQFPIPIYRSLKSNDSLQNNLVLFLQFMLKSFKYSFSVSADYKKGGTWKRHDFCMTILAAIREYLHSSTSHKDFKEISLLICAKDEHNFETAVNVCEEVLPLFWPGARSSANQSVYSINIILEEGQLDCTEADALACTIPEDRNLESGSVSTALFKKAGRKLQSDLDKVERQKNDFKSIFVLKGPYANLSCKYVLFGMMFAYDPKFAYQFETPDGYFRSNIDDFTKDCLDAAEELHLCSIAFPAIGSGNLEYPIEIVADEMYRAVRDWDLDVKSKYLKEVRFVIYPLDTEAIKEFKKAESKHKKRAEHSSSGTSVMYVQNTTSSNPRDANSKGSSQYKFEQKLDLTQSNFKIADVEQEIQSIQAQRDVCCVLHSNKSQVTISGKSDEDVKAAKRQIISLLLPPRNTKTESDDIFITNENVVLKVYIQDILNLPVDCIVNAANTNLEHRGGIAKAISNAAGVRLNKESFDYVKSYGNLKVGSACKTTAGNLKYRFVLHAVGPCWEFYQPYKKEDVQRCEQDLYNAVLTSLCLAEKHDAKTVALPTISSGKYACPKEICSVQYARAILDYSRLAKHPLREIHIVDLNKETIDIIKKTFRVMIPGGVLPDFYRPEVYKMSDKVISRQASYNAGDNKKTHRPSSAKTTDHLDKRASNSYLTSSIYPYAEYAKTSQGLKTNEFIFHLGIGQELHIYTGDILSLPNVDIIACGNDKNGKSLGGLAMALARKCRDPYKKNVETKFETPRNPGDIVFISSKGLTNVKWIAHAVPFMKTDCKTREESTRNVASMYENIFNGLKDKGCHSLALPLIGTGKGSAKPDFHCKCLLEALETVCSFNKKFKCTIHLVHWEPEKTRIAIECVEQKIRESPCHVDRRPAKQNMFRSTSEESSIKPPRKGHSQSVYVKSTQNQSNVNIDKRRHSSNSDMFASSQCDYDKDSKENFYSVPENMKDLRKEEHDKVKDPLGLGEEQSAMETDMNLGANKEKDDQEDEETCVICMGIIKNAKHLPCGHSFCVSCIEKQFTYKETCPTCGQICGIIKGDQPFGTMVVKINNRDHCAGYENVGRIEITYSFQSGIQKEGHPNPGKPYKGISRTAFLPDNKRGKEILEMLRVAFDRKLVFTIGSSRTTGAEGVITWNDIHHKTDPKPNTQFGYPDPTYLDRVTDELKAKGVTVDDIPTLSMGKRKK